MKKVILSCLVIVVCTISCDKKENSEEFGQMSFGSNYHIVNCPVKVSVYIDDLYVGELTNPCDSIVDCGIEGNVMQSVEVGTHTYKCVLQSLDTDSCYNEVNGTVSVGKDECKKIFINVLESL
ncbi:MAG: hypothetical protein ACOX4D_04240 [Bacteroidales bacterium]|jgi:hypothetical protein